ncbi:hypothetical protein LY76DRAFT_469258, partial [Colletotrichum caudatum]
ESREGPSRIGWMAPYSTCWLLGVFLIARLRVPSPQRCGFPSIWKVSGSGGEKEAGRTSRCIHTCPTLVRQEVRMRVSAATS